MKYAACLYLCGLLASASEAPKAIFDRAVQSLAVGDYVAAEQGFESVLRQQPANIGAIGNLGILYARTNRAAKAVTEYKRALELSPNDEAILLNLGILYLKQDLHSLAMPYFERVVKIDPENGQSRQLLDVCRLYTGDIAPAIRDLNELHAANPREENLLFLLGFAYLKSGDPEAAQTIFKQMFDVSGPAQAQFMLGRACYEAALFPKAEESFLEVQRLDPDFPGLHLELGKLYISCRRTDDAIRELQTVLHADPANEDANYFLGSLLVRESHYVEGITYLETAKRLKPDSWAIYFYLGLAKLRTQKLPDAVALLQKAVELNPDDANAQYQLARALQAAGQKAAATRAFQHARDLKAGELNEVKIPGVR